MQQPLLYEDLVKQHEQILRSLQYESGLFAASSKTVATGYDKSWLRDNFYECLAFEVLDDWSVVEKTYDALLKVFEHHKDKIVWATQNKPTERYQYIHARVHPETFEEFWEEWGNKQNDAVGAILFRIGELEKNRPGCIFKNDAHKELTQLLVDYLSSIEYWHDLDSGMWEEDEEIHASSVGACVAGLKAVRDLEGIYVDNELISKGEKMLNELLPRESKNKFVDLALLSLIWPYGVVNKDQADDILENTEYLLERERGVIRYKNDYYYNKNPDGYSEEAEWTFGLAWLAIIYERRGEQERAQHYVDKLLSTVTQQGVPELYYSHTNFSNENNPLGWSESLFIVALHGLNNKILVGETLHEAPNN
ncbi:MAG: glycoside hydrolase family 15 protein [Candidatus Woesearchaeota archaeon]